MLTRGVLALVALLAATNLHTSAWRAVRDLHVLDTQSYLAMADASPGLPAVLLPHHHAQRLAAPWAVGLVAHAVDAPPHATFRVLVMVLVVLAGVALAVLLRHRVDDTRLVLVIAAMVVLSPFLFRLPMAAPGMAPDVLFVAGLTAALLALDRGSVAGVVLAAVAMAAGRQTAVVVLPGLVWLVVRRWDGWRGWGVALLVTTVVVGTYVASDVVARRFAMPPRNVEHVIGIVAWVQADWGVARVVTFVGFLARGALPFVPLLALAFGWCGTGLRRLRHPTSAPTLLIAAGIAAQPTLGGPAVTGYDVTRLTALALPAVALAIGGEIAARRTAPLPAWSMWALLMTVGIGSLHHAFSIVGPRPDLEWVFVAVFLATSAHAGLDGRRHRATRAGD